MVETIDSEPVDWWLSFYENSPFDHYMESQALCEVEETADLLIDCLGIVPGDLIFDQCCGKGRLSFALSKAGARIVGVDSCSRYINAANSMAEESRADCNFYLGDAFEFRAPEPCQAAFNWWTSFGYSSSTRRNREMLLRVYESLSPGGKFAIDVPNMASVLRNYEPEQLYEYETPLGPVSVKRYTRLDLSSGTREQRWQFTRAGNGEIIFDTCIRLYMPDRMKELLASCGFEVVDQFGTTGKSPLDLDSPRCMTICRKPADSIV